MPARKPSDLSEARRLFEAGFKLCKLKPDSKAPIGTKWNVSPITQFDDNASGYGVILAMNGLASIDPDDETRARIAFKAAGFDLDELMNHGVATRSTRPGSGGRSAFQAPKGCGWYKFRARVDGKVRIIFELRADSPNLQDTIPGLQYHDRISNRLCTQEYANGKKLDQAGPVPPKLATWWRRMSEDRDFRMAQEKLMARALGMDAVPDLSVIKSEVTSLPFYAPNIRTAFNEKHRVEDLLEKYGYQREDGGRWRSPDGTGAAGIRKIPNKHDLWYSDHGSDPAHGTFDAWTLYVIYEHNSDVDSAIRAEGGTPDYKPQPTEVPDEDAPPMRMHVVGELMDTEFKPVERIFDGSFPLTPGVTLLAGKPKHGKSWLAMGVAIACATGEQYMDSTRNGLMQSVYIACDDPSVARFARRAKAFRPAQKLDGLLLITEIDKNAGSALDLLGNLLEAQPTIRMVVIDTLSAFRQAQRSENPYQQEYDEVKAINDWAHKHNICVLLVHHLRKGEVDPKEPFESISGTLGLQGAVDGIMVLARRDLESDFDSALNEKLAGLWYRGRDLDEEIDIGMRLHDGRWSIMGSSRDVFQAGTQREILNVLEASGDWMTSKEIHAAGDFDCKADSVKKAAGRMAKKGLIESHAGAMPGKSGGGGGFRAKRKG